MSENTVQCTECDAAVAISENPEVGEILTCNDCSVELEIKALDPMTVEMAPEVEEDWGE